MESVPSKYPATEENTTLTESRSFVISVKFLTMDCVTGCVSVADKLFFLRLGKDTLPVFFPQYNNDNLLHYFSIFSILTPF